MRLKRKTRLIIGIIAAVLVVGAFVSIIFKIDKLETTKTVGTFLTYEVGKLNDTTGKGYKKADIENVDDYEEWMHLKEYINADGLKCELAEDAKIIYQVNFYDENYVFLGKVDCTTDYDFSKNTVESLTSAKFALIEISPTADPDGVISATELSKYAKMLTVTYNK